MNNFTNLAQRSAGVPDASGRSTAAQDLRFLLEDRNFSSLPLRSVVCPTCRWLQAVANATGMYGKAPPRCRECERKVHYGGSA
jgi:hypothetical protein